MSIAVFKSPSTFALSGLLVVALGACASKTEAPPESPEPVADRPVADAPADDAEKADDADAEEADKPAAEPEKPKAAGDVVAILAANPKTKTFSELLPLSDYGKGLHGTEGAGFTILAPSDEAFAKLPKGTIDRWKKKPEEIDGLIRLHVILGTNDVNKLTGYRTAPTAAGKELEVKVQDDSVSVGGAKLIESDVAASNGVVHVIDKVIKLK